MEKIWTFLLDGAPFSFFNVAVLALVLGIIAERTFYILTKYRVNSREFMAQIRKLVQAGNIDRAIKRAVVKLRADVRPYLRYLIAEVPAEIAHLTPDDFLTWLGSWVGIAIDEPNSVFCKRREVDAEP